jgi:hypothetical protein
VSRTVRVRRRLVAAVVVLLALASCSDDEEPGGSPERDKSFEPAAEVEPTRAEVDGAPTTEDDHRSYVSPSGDDDDAGTEDEPFRTLQHAMERLRPGDVLVVDGGTYREEVVLPGEVLRPGRPDAPITVQAAPGERPVIVGRLGLTGADHWTVDGINVTWAPGTDSDEHMVQFLGGTGWRFTNAEVWGAESFSALNVDNGASDFRLDHLFVHDTLRSNDRNQDHLIYIASGNEGGVIERNVLARSPNGRGIKVGPGSSDEPGSDHLVIRYNTFYDNQGPSSVRFSGDSSDNEVYGNLFVDVDDEAAVTAFELEGDGNVVRGNAHWDTEGAVDATDGLSDGGGNVEVDPQFADPGNGDFTVRNAEAAGYGAFA